MRVAFILIGLFSLLAICWGMAVNAPVSMKMDKVLQIMNTKKSLKPDEETQPSDNSFPEDRWKKDVEEIKDDFSFPFEKHSSFFSNRKESEKPRNVVLLFIDESKQNEDVLWKSLKGSFPVQGFLQSCRNDRNPFRISIDEDLVSGSNANCECENILQSNIASLLSWAHRKKDMTTGSVTATNFSIPSDLEYESPIIIKQNFGEVEGDTPKIMRPQFYDNWKVIDLNKDAISPASPSSIHSIQKSENAANGDSVWDFIDSFSKIRIAFFRNWLKSVNNKNEDDFSPKTPISIIHDWLELMEDTVEKLKAISGEKGFIMVAAATGNELSPAIDLLQKEISSNDTLVVVAGICSKNKKQVPFFAYGPRSKYLYEANSIWDIPNLVKKAVSDCQGLRCETESINPIWWPNPEFPIRFARKEPSETLTVNSSIAEGSKIEATKVNKEENVKEDANKNHTEIQTQEKTAEVIISTKKESENSHLLISNNTNQATSITSTSQVKNEGTVQKEMSKNHTENLAQQTAAKVKNEGKVQEDANKNHTEIQAQETNAKVPTLTKNDSENRNNSIPNNNNQATSEVTKISKTPNENVDYETKKQDQQTTEANSHISMKTSQTDGNHIRSKKDFHDNDGQHQMIKNSGSAIKMTLIMNVAMSFFAIHVVDF